MRENKDKERNKERRRLSNPLRKFFGKPDAFVVQHLMMIEGLGGNASAYGWGSSAEHRYSEEVSQTSYNVRWDSEGVLKSPFMVRMDADDVPQTSNLRRDSQ
ncbi:unnamed protein product [Heligmosomoides polygyrus]|uniref:Uncharacterized protein n=1 Tax=Heligmosomoides polygyrus TaxID=6339 RepID=A0A183GK25_HELPZ|nr:unnamed protein product [Heligmosomoides polygyrus]